MAKVKSPAKQSKQARKLAEKRKKFKFPLKRTNFMILAAGIALIVLGYIFMAIPDDPDAFLTRTLAPVLLVFSFVVVIPYGLLYNDDKDVKS